MSADFTTRRYDAVFFDLDATLIDESYIASASIAACAEFAAAHPAFDAAALARANLETWLSYWPEIEDPWILGEFETSELRLEVWRRTLGRFEVTDEALIAEVAELHHGYEMTHYGAFEDALSTLESLRAAGVKLAVVTNGASDTQREKLDILGVTPRVDVIVVSAEAGAAKPDAAVFSGVLAEFGVPIERVAHVGDSAFADVGGANAAGITSIWVNRTGKPRAADLPTPDHEITALAEVMGIVGVR